MLPLYPVAVTPGPELAHALSAKRRACVTRNEGKRGVEFEDAQCVLIHEMKNPAGRVSSPVRVVYFSVHLFTPACRAPRERLR